ncbi:Protein transport protein sec20 [Pichia californica]|nr:Protein transport protein sec20 [[Candida] californica]
MSNHKEVLDKASLELREVYIAIKKYFYTSDDRQQVQYEDIIDELFNQIELKFSMIESQLLPTLPTNNEENNFEFELYKSTERYNDLRSMYRSKKIDEKVKYLETLYLKSFDNSELQLDDSKESEESSRMDETKNRYTSIDDAQLEELSAQEKLLQQNSILTDKLQNVNALMKSTLLAGEINLSELELSTNSLSSLSDNYAFFGNVLNKTNTLRPILLIIWLIFSPIKMLFWNTSSGSIPVSLSSMAMATTIISSSCIESSTITSMASMATEITTEAVTEILHQIRKDEL